nr:MAG TPA: hypothetical protein [Caudoviricetes sp.]
MRFWGVRNVHHTTPDTRTPPRTWGRAAARLPTQLQTTCQATTKKLSIYAFNLL